MFSLPQVDIGLYQEGGSDALVLLATVFNLKKKQKTSPLFKDM